MYRTRRDRQTHFGEQRLVPQPCKHPPIVQARLRNNALDMLPERLSVTIGTEANPVPELSPHSLV